MQIIQAGLEHLNILIDIRFTFLEALGKLNPEKEEELRTATRAYFVQHLQDGTFIPLLGIQNGKVVASAFLTLENRIPNINMPTGKHGYAGNIYVDPACRGKGYGTVIVKELLKAAKQHGVEHINLTATPDGEPVYRKIGFTDIGEPALGISLADVEVSL